MFARSRVVWGLLVAVGSLSAGCMTEAEEEVVSGDGRTEEAIVSERQLVGSELPDKTLALTFDDGPGARTVELSDYLASKGIVATFFINGSKVPGRQGVVEKVVLRGHLLANHSQNHLHLPRLSAAALTAEIAKTDAILDDLQPAGPWLLRAPFGDWNGATARRINATPMKKYVGSVFWDVGGQLTATAAADWDCWGRGVAVARCADLYMNEIHAKKRGIVLMHDVHDRTVDLVKIVVPKLVAEGYKFTSVAQVPAVKRALGTAGVAEDDGCSSATLGRIVPENSCVQSRADEKWHCCVDGDWTLASGPDDPRCKAKFPL